MLFFHYLYLVYEVFFVLTGAQTLLRNSCQIVIVITFSNDLSYISVFLCHLFQGFRVDIEPRESLANDVLVLHLERLLAIVVHLFYQLRRILEKIANVRGVAQQLATRGQHISVSL